MIANPTIARPLLALAAAAIAAPLAAQEPLTVTGRPMARELVSFSDLDLRQRSAQHMLKRRVSQASQRVCNEAEGPFSDVAVPGYGRDHPSMTCADLTYADAKPQIAAAIDRARSGQQLAAMSLIVSTPRAR